MSRYIFVILVGHLILHCSLESVSMCHLYVVYRALLSISLRMGYRAFCLYIVGQLSPAIVLISSGYELADSERYV